MSEKFNGCIGRKIKDVISFCKLFGMFFLYGILPGIALTIVLLLIEAVIEGLIVSVCWNMAMPTMFGVQEKTLFQAFVFSSTISCLRSNYTSGTKSVHTKLKDFFFTFGQKENIANIVSTIFIYVDMLISLLITIVVTMYSWNNILPQLLNFELVQINFWQALGFTYLFRRLFKKSKSEDDESEDNENKENVQKKEVVDKATIEIESVSEDEPT